MRTRWDSSTRCWSLMNSTDDAKERLLEQQPAGAILYALSCVGWFQGMTCRVAMCNLFPVYPHDLFPRTVATYYPTYRRGIIFMPALRTNNLSAASTFCEFMAWVRTSAPGAIPDLCAIDAVGLRYMGTVPHSHIV